MTTPTPQDFAYNTALAVIGMSGRFPGAANVDEFWQNLVSGTKSIKFFSDEELRAADVDPDLMSQPNYVKAGTVIEKVDAFDAAFFGYTPREAETMDPQIRLFLECSWEALENAAYDPEIYAGLVGVFAGSALSTYMTNNIFTNPHLLESLGLLQIGIVNSADSLASTVSYKFNFRGPSVAIQTFCSTSLVAVHFACQSLLNYECDMALAGGAAISVPHGTGYIYQEGGILSPDGECRTFDARGQGSVMGNGVGAVLLKRLDEAIEDGDNIYAVIRGSAVNNDGIVRAGYTAPGLDGQSEVVAEAMGHADVEAETINYLEAHGTATALGDSVELAAAIKAFQKSTTKKQFCALGSVKPNIGHLDRASGVAGLIKTVLALKHEQIPPSMNFEQSSPDLDLVNSPFYVNTKLTEWKSNGFPRRAGVSSFGLGGTNAHVVLQETPPIEPSGRSRPYQLLLISAKTSSALDTATANLALYLKQHPQINFADVAYTLQVGRSAFNHRRILVCRDLADALSALEPLDPKRLPAVNQSNRDRSVAFLFPGVGDHYAGMAQELYQSEPVFRDAVDHCCESLITYLGQDLRDVIYPGGARPVETPDTAPALDLRALLGRNGNAAPTDRSLHRTALAQPAVFVVEYALAQLLVQWGIRPQAMLGYSVGEYVAACLAGVLSLEDALRLVARRAQLIQALPEGAMLAVSLPETEVQRFLSKTINLAVINAPNTCVLAGPPEAIAALEQQLAALEIACRRVETSHAFHSAMLAPITDELTELACTITLNPPQIPYLSNLTGTWITEAQATDPAYWAQHMCATVRFADGVRELLQEPERLLLEVGPGQALGSFVKQHPACARERMALVLSMLPGATERQSDLAYVLGTLGKLWQAGVTIDWAGFYTDERRLRLPLPTYPFERQRYWIGPGKAAKTSSTMFDTDKSELERIPNIEDWFYVPSWKRSGPSNGVTIETRLQERRCWLVLADECGVGTQLASWLADHDQEVITVSAGSAFTRLSEHSYTVAPSARADYTALLQELHSKGKLPSQVVHLWTVTAPMDEAGESDSDLAQTLDRGFYSLLALAQTLGEQGVDACQINVVSNDMQDVTGSERMYPVKTTVIGPCKVIPQEYQNLTARSIDITLPSAGTPPDAALIRQLATELTNGLTEEIVALRGTHRWVQSFESVKVPDTIKTSRLRQRGVYVITGGLGGIGLAMAEYLADMVQARLVLLGRTALPPREDWPDLLALHGTSEGVDRRIHAVQALEARGTEVLMVQADVADAAQVQAAVQQAVAHFGTIHGVIHAAGVPGAGLISLQTPEVTAGVLAPKVQGTMALARALRGLPLDFLVLFSSLSSVTGGGPGQIAYCAGNAFLDAYARRHFDENGMTVAISWGEWLWDAWQAGLQGYPEEVRAFFRNDRRTFGISFDEGTEVLRRVLSCQIPHVFITTRDLPVTVERSKDFSISHIVESLQQQRQSQPRYPRPVMATSYIEPRNEMEEQIAAIWGDVLGIGQIGIEDNFFELGGNSLLGLDLVARMRKALKAEQIATQVLYEAPTISALAEYVQQMQQGTTVVENWEAQTDKRRENLKHFKRRSQMGIA